MSDSTALLVRRAVPIDAVTIATYNIQMALETENLRLDPYTVDAGVRAVLNDPTKGLYYVAEVGGRVVGQLMITWEWSDWRNGQIWWIQSVYVHADHRKKGIFKRIFDEVEADARRHGAVMLRLYVERANESAQATYARLGLHDAHYHVLEKKL